MQSCPHCNEQHGTNVLFCPSTGKAISVSRIQEGEIVEDKYQIIRRIASGGMGAIYEVKHLRIGKHFAMKLLLPELAENPEITQRFEREAKAASAIGHPNIIEITDMGTTGNGLQFIVMELLTGEDVSALIARDAPLAPERAVEIMSQVLLALEAAHGAGIVHRDLKPENVYLSVSPTGEETVKLLDFGISKIAGTDEAKLRLTSTGLILGTPFYMSPEQAKGLRDIDHRSDLYAAGVILFETITGSRPYESDSLNSLLYQILAGEIRRPSELAPDIPTTLENTILKALATDKNERFQSGAEFREALLGHAVVERPSGGAMLGSESGIQARPKDWLSPTLSADGHTPVAMVDSESPVTQTIGSRRRLWPLVAALTVLLAVGVTLAVLYIPSISGAGSSESKQRGKSDPRGGVLPDSIMAQPGKAAAQRATSMRTQPETARPASIRISVDLKPAGATLTLDSAHVPENPFTMPRDGKHHTLVAQAEGYQPTSVVLLADQSQRLQIHLDQKTKPPRAMHRTSRRRRRHTSTDPTVRPRRPAMPSGMKVIKISTDID